MLKPAIVAENRINSMFADLIWFTEKGNYFNAYRANCLLDINNNNATMHQFVSVDTDYTILGYMEYNIDYYTSVVSDIRIVSFETTATFGRDLMQMIDDIFTKYNINKIEFEMVGGNPVERHYRKFIDVYHGREIGVYKQSIRFPNGEYHDSVMFEMFREDYLRGKKELEEKRNKKKGKK